MSNILYADYENREFKMMSVIEVAKKLWIHKEWIGILNLTDCEKLLLEQLNDYPERKDCSLLFYDTLRIVGEYNVFQDLFKFYDKIGLVYEESYKRQITK